MIPDILHIGPVPIHLFGIFLALAFLAAGWAVGRELERKGYDPALASSAVVWGAVGGLLGARLWIVLDAWPEFVRAPWTFLVTGGGFVFYGGLLGGTLAVTLFFWREHIPWLAGADACAPAIALGQAIGRLGCQAAGDGDWGKETALPWGMAYPYAVVGWDKPPGVRVHPTPLYEAAAYAAIFALLWRLRREPAADGAIRALYLGPARQGRSAQPVGYLVRAVHRGDAVHGEALRPAPRHGLRSPRHQPGRGREAGGRPVRRAHAPHLPRAPRPRAPGRGPLRRDGLPRDLRDRPQRLRGRARRRPARLGGAGRDRRPRGAHRRRGPGRRAASAARAFLRSEGCT